MRKKSLGRIRLQLVNEDYKCKNCGNVETPVLFGDISYPPNSENAGEILAYMCENEDCIEPKE